MAWCAKADLTRDVDAAGNTRPALLHVCTGGHGAGQVVESQDELTTVDGIGNSYFSGQFVVDTALVSGSYQMLAASAGNGQTNNLNQGTSGSGSIFTDADNTWGTGTLVDAATLGVDAHWVRELCSVGVA